MLSSVLHSPRAIRVNVEIMRAFVRLRQILAHNVDLAQKLNALEKRYDRQFKVVFDAIHQLMEPPAKAQKQIGFRTGGPSETKRSIPYSAIAGFVQGGMAPIGCVKVSFANRIAPHNPFLFWERPSQKRRREFRSKRSNVR